MVLVLWMAFGLSALPPAAQEAVNLGKSADEKQDYLAAIAHFQEALELAPEAPELFFYLGVEEAKLPARELRAIAWLGAYLSLRADGPEAAKVKSEIQKLRFAHRKTVLRLVKAVEDEAQFAERKGPSLRDVARKLAEVGDVDSALQVAAHLAELPESQAEAYAAVANVQARSGDIAGALKTTSLIADSEPVKGDAYVHIVTYQVARELAGARKTLGGIQNSLTRDRARKIVSSFQARNRDVQGGLITAASIVDAEVRSSARSDIAHAQVDAGDLSGAFKTALLIPSTWDGNFVLQNISLSQARKGDIAGALKSAAAYKSSSLRSRVAVVQAERGDLAGALKTAASSEKDKRDLTRSLVQAAFARSRMKRGDATGAQEALAAARQAAEVVANQADKDPALREVALAQAGLGDVAGSLMVASSIQEAYLKAQTLSDLAELQAKGGDIAGALETANAVKFNGDDSRAVARQRVAMVQARAGDFAGALSTASVHRSIVELQVEKGDLVGAQETLELIPEGDARLKAQELVDAARFNAGDRTVFWRQRLDDSNREHEGALNAAPFVDLAGHLHFLSTVQGAGLLFQELYRTFIDLIDAELAVNALLAKQGIK